MRSLKKQGGWVGAAIGAVGSIAAAHQTTSASMGATRRQRRFHKKMSNTAYQRAMDDMRQAGLNPILAYQQGGASTPQQSMPQVADYGDAAVSGATAGLTAKNLRAQNDNLEEQNKNLAETRNEIQARTKKLEAEADVARYQARRGKAVTTPFDWFNRSGVGQWEAAQKFSRGTREMAAHSGRRIRDSVGLGPGGYMRQLSDAIAEFFGRGSARARPRARVKVGRPRVEKTYRRK